MLLAPPSPTNPATLCSPYDRAIKFNGLGDLRPRLTVPPFGNTDDISKSVFWQPWISGNFCTATQWTTNISSLNDSECSEWRGGASKVIERVLQHACLVCEKLGLRDLGYAGLGLRGWGFSRADTSAFERRGENLKVL